MKIARGNIIGAVVCALVGIAVWIVTDVTIRSEGRGLFHTDARLFPHFISFSVTVISIAWLVRAIADYRAAKNRMNEAEGNGEAADWAALIRVGMFVILFFVYVQLIKPLGFVWSSLLAAEAALVILREKKPLLYVVVGGCVLLLYVVFQYLLKVRLP